MVPFHEIRNVPAVKAIGVRGEFSLWDIDTVFSRLYDKVLEHKLVVTEPAIGVRHGEVGVPEAFRSDYEIFFPLAIEPGKPVPGTEVREIPGAEVAVFVHRGPYEAIPRTYEKVLDWLRENRYEVAGEPREVFLVAPEPHSGGTQDDMLTEIHVPVRVRSLGEIPGESAGGQARKAA